MHASVSPLHFEVKIKPMARVIKRVDNENIFNIQQYLELSGVKKEKKEPKKKKKKDRPSNLSSKSLGEMPLIFKNGYEGIDFVIQRIVHRGKRR
jgi:hypothetical protein